MTRRQQKQRAASEARRRAMAAVRAERAAAISALRLPVRIIVTRAIARPRLEREKFAGGSNLSAAARNTKTLTKAVIFYAFRPAPGLYGMSLQETVFVPEWLWPTVEPALRKLAAPEPSYPPCLYSGDPAPPFPDPARWLFSDPRNDLRESPFKSIARWWLMRAHWHEDWSLHAHALAERMSRRVPGFDPNGRGRSR